MKFSRLIYLSLCLAGAIVVPVGLTATAAQEAAETGDAVSSRAADLEAQRDSTQAELEALAETIDLSDNRIGELQDEIASLEQRAVDIREALVESAEKRNTIESNIEKGERALTSLRKKEGDLRTSLYERRGLLAEVLGALERMGRNPPPAILVKPSDALGSVRSAILLGAVVPGIRAETESLLNDLDALSRTLASIETERQSLKQLMVSRLEEEERMKLLLQENRQQSELSARELAEEQEKAEELAAKAGSMKELMASLEGEIASVREATRLAEEEDRRRALEAEKNINIDPDRLPDKNRIAPAFALSTLKGKLALPVRGEILRSFGDPNGAGHKAQGMTVAANANALVTAPADGWVIYAGKFRSYGQMIIMNAGEDYRIVMSGMENVNVRPGQFVVAGEPVATMGAKRVASATALALETDQPTLYVEFWQNDKPIDSRAWWSAQYSGKASNDT